MDSSGKLALRYQPNGRVRVNEVAPHPGPGRALSLRSVKDMRGAGQAIRSEALLHPIHHRLGRVHLVRSIGRRPRHRRWFLPGGQSDNML